MQYSLEVFSKLRDSNDMQQYVPNNKEKLLVLGQVICDYGLHEIVGVTLVHRHHNLAQAERLVTEIIDDVWHTMPRVINDEGIVPWSWKLEQYSGELRWFPVEFILNNTSHHREVECAERVQRNSHFLHRFATTLVELGVDHLFGLGLLPCRPDFRKIGTTLFEQSNKTRRTTTTRVVALDELGDISGGVTLWNFWPEGNGVVKGCAHGNSRHCCGPD